MSSDREEPILDGPENWWLEDPEFQRKAHAIARHIVRRYRLPIATAEDLYQAAMMKLIRYTQNKKRRKERGEIKRPLAFFYTVARNEARNIFTMSADNEARRISSRDQGYLTAALEDMPDEAFSDHLEAVRHIESTVLLNEVLACLDEEERHLFTHWVVEEHSFRQIASLMKESGVEISHVTVANRLRRIQEKLVKAFLGTENLGRTFKR